MIWNMLLMFLVIGWTVNGGSFAARLDMRWTLINSGLAGLAGAILIYRLS